ncbi:Ataxin-3 [Gaertneriomyces sp. JEL0708]|nr:Ataxin-3 [Gaertneriomyces sp. JEL0708]
MDLIPFIFHEKQEGQLCAQHALNTLLQGPYFTAVDLADIARQLDDAERSAMAEGGMDREEFQKFVAGGSNNYDDSGFFSVQVIANALKVWNLEITPIGSQGARGAKENPTEEQAFICNLQEHWFSLRKFGGSARRWYNLNSAFNEPEYVSETYLGLLLAQLTNEGYSIFVVSGVLPQSEGDVYAQTSPVPSAEDMPKGPSKSSTTRNANKRQKHSHGTEDDELAKAIAMSMGQDWTGSEEAAGSTDDELDDEEMKRAIQASLDEGGVDQKSLRDAINASLRESEEAVLKDSSTSISGGSGVNPGESSTLLSPGSSDPKSEPVRELSPEEVRAKRLARFGS